MTPANSGMLESVSQLVRIVKLCSVGVYTVISAENIVGMTHLNPEEPILSTLVNKGWIVNSYIYLMTWNNIYYILEDQLNTVVKRI